MAYIGTPIVADSLYGAGFRTKRAILPEPVGRTLALLRRQALHAAVLRFRHPSSGRLLAFESPLPGDIAKLCAEIEGSMGKVAKI
jgi:23S rRNA pseudouridine1911/1915/1917 synthase